MLRASLCLAALLLPALPVVAAAQQAAGQQPPVAHVIPAQPADVASIDAIVGALYDVISGPAGQKRDWDRFRSLFIPGARLIPSIRTPQGDIRHRVMTPDDYATTSGPMLEERGFFEREIGRVTEQFGSVAHVFSSYDSKRTLADAQPFMRGINSIQLFNDGARWWVVTVFWDSESPANPIPARYLSGGGL